jgi:fumarate reductase subunit C
VSDAPADHGSSRGEARAWFAQRASAAVLALCVVVHLATMIVVVRHGLSAEAILGRTRGSVSWAAFYCVFVLAVAVHAPLGLRTVAAEWLGWRGRGADAAWTVVAIALLVLGARAIAAVAL